MKNFAKVLLICFSMCLTLTACSPDEVVFGLLDMVYGGQSAASENDYTDMFLNQRWAQYAISDENGYRENVYIKEDGSVEYVYDDTWWEVSFDGAEHFMNIQVYAWSDENSGTYTWTDCETHAFRYDWSNAAVQGSMYNGCGNEEWYYAMSYEGLGLYEHVFDEYGNVLPEMTDFYDINEGWIDTTSDNWKFFFNGNDWMRMTIVEGQMELAWFRSTETEPYEIRYLYDLQSDMPQKSVQDIPS